MDIPENANQDCPGPGSSGAGSASSCEGCPNQKQCSKGEVPVDPSLEVIRKRLADVKHKVLVLSGKGGVGKSTVSSQLALTLSEQGHAVGLLDIDLCGPSIPRMMGLEGHEIHTSSDGWQPVFCTDSLAVMSIGFLLASKNVAVIWRGARKDSLIKQLLTDVNWGPLDYLIVDTPPGTSDEHLSITRLLQLGEQDGAVIVTTPQEVALNDVRKEIGFCIKTGTRMLGLVENMAGFVCPHCSCESTIFTGKGAASLCQEFKLPLLGRIPIEARVSQSSERGLWVGQSKEGKAAEAFLEVIKNVLKGMK